MVSGLLWIVGIVAVGYLLSVVVMSCMVVILRFAKDPLKSVEPADYPAQMRAVAEFSRWAEQNDFVWIGAYEVRALGSTFIVAWSKCNEPTYFCVYCFANVSKDFVSILNGKGELTTGDSGEGCLLPSRKNPR